jgi:hypothetical protein
VEEFDTSRRSRFKEVEEKSYNDQQPDFLPSFDGLSAKYNQEDALINIDQRYINTHKKLSVSLGIWEQVPEFKKIIMELRGEDWLDW